VYDTLAQIAPGDWRALIRRHLDEYGTKALFGGLERSGWKLEYTAKNNFWLEYYEKRKQADTYTVDHSSQSYVIDPAGRLRLLVRPERLAADLPDDLRTLLKEKT